MRLALQVGSDIDEQDGRDAGPSNGDGGGLTLAIRAPFRGVKKGESISVNGACLTVERVIPGWAHRCITSW